MPEDIGAKLKVTGESAYSKAMRDAAKNTRALGSELKLAEAQFEATGNAQEYMAKRDKVLKEQLEQQEKAVKAAKDMLEQLATAGYDKNSTKVLEWRSKLAQAEQQVLQINNAIHNNANGLDEAGKAYDNLGESMQNAAMDADTAKVSLGGVSEDASGLQVMLGKIGQKFGWDGLNDTLHGINDAIDQVIARAAQLGKTIWDAGVDATVWADTLLTDASVYGLDPETLQQWQYASRFIDVSVDDIIKSWHKLNTNITSDSEDIALAFNELGVATRDINGDVRGTDDVFWDVIAALSRVENPTKRDSLAMKLLGKSVSELNPLIEAGRDLWEEKASQAPLVSTEQLTSLGSANDAIEDMNARLETLKNDALAYLAPVIEQIADAISEAAKALNDFLDSEEGQKALTSLQESISGLITDFTELDFGQILKDATDNITGIITSISDFLGKKDDIVNGIIAIGMALGGLKIATLATDIAKLVANIGALGLGGSAAGAAAGSATGHAVGTAVRTGAGAGIGAALKAAGTAAAPYVGAALGVGAGSYLIDSASTKAFNEKAEAAEELADALEDAGDEGERLAEQIRILNDVRNMDLSTAEGFGSLDTDLLRKYAPGADLFDLLEEFGGMDAWLKSGDPTTGMNVDVIIDDLIDRINDSSDDVSEATSELGANAGEALEKSLGNTPETVGANISTGLANGISERAFLAINAAADMAKAVVETITSVMDIGSPSKVMAQLGEYIGQGLAIGMDSTNGIVADAAGQMSSVILRAPAIPDAPRASAAGAGDMPGLILNALSHMVVQIDGHDAGQVILPTIEELVTEQMTSRRWDG